MTRKSAVLIAGLVGLTVLLGVAGPVPHLGPSYPWALLATGSVLFLIGWGIAALIRRFRNSRRPLDGSTGAQRRASPLRGAVCVVLVVVLELLLTRFVAPFLSPFWLSEGLYYGVLIAAGVFLVVWAGCGSHYAVLAAVVGILCISAAEYISYGQGLNLALAFGDFLAMFYMWPLDAAVALSAWLITSAVVR